MDEPRLQCRPGISLCLKMHCIGFTAAAVAVGQISWFFLPGWAALLLGWLVGAVLYVGALLLCLLRTPSRGDNRTVETNKGRTA